MTKREGLRIFELPGFERHLPGAILYLVLGIPLGLAAGRRGVFMALELSSQGLAASACALIARSRFVGFSFSSGRRSEIEYCRNSRLWPLRRSMLRRAQWLVGQTPFAAKELEAIAGPDRVTAVPTPVDPVHAPDLTGLPRALFTGRLSQQKGLEGLAQAWLRVLERVPDARLTFAGSGGGWTWGWPPVERELRQRVEASEQLRRSVTFTGWVADVSTLLGSTDVYVYPSLSDGMSNALLEACAWGRVVVASDIEANRTVLGDQYPLLFPVEDVDAMAERIVAALSDETVRGRARDQILARIPAFQTDAVLDRIEALLSGDGGRRPASRWSGAGRPRG